MALRLALALDFDGTVTTNDIGVRVMEAFGLPDWHDGIRRYRAGELTQSGLMRWEFARLPEGRLDEMRRFALCESELRPGLHGLVALCRAGDIPLEVVSNGMSFYVEAVLERQGLGDVEFVAPVLAPPGGGGGPVGFGEGVETCETTGLCKCARVRRLRAGGRSVVFAGDGISDFCVAGQADFLFARGELAGYCERSGIGFERFEDFHDVTSGLRRLLAG